MTTIRNLQRTLALAVGAATLLAGCATTRVVSQYESGPASQRKPARILVFDFAVSADDVQENSGIVARLARAGDDRSEAARALTLGREVANRLAEDLVAGIRELGLPAQRAGRGTVLQEGDTFLAGRFVNIDEGNRARRLVVGLGAGASSVDAQYFVRQVSGGRIRDLAGFSTHADSGKMPGAAVTMGAGAAASGGVTAASMAVNAAAGGVKTYRSDVERMAGRSADEAIGYLHDYFLTHGWIAAH